MDQLQKNTSEDKIENGLKLMNFCASWSRPCINQCSILEDLSALLPDCIDIIKVNIDEPDNDSDKYMVNAVPTLCLVSNGKEIKRFIGVQQLDTLVEAIKFYMKKEKCNV